MLCDRWSTRRHDIDDRLEDLRAEFAAAHGREPTKKESIALAQRANLETRDAKHEPRSVAEQRTQWRAEALDALGEVGLAGMLATVLRPGRGHGQPVTTQWLTEAAARVVSELESHQSVWHSWHLYAEAQRHVRGLDVATEQVGDLVDHLVQVVTTSLINLTPDDDTVTEPAGLRREDGTSVYRHTGADTFTSQRILDAEQRIIDTAGQCIDPALDADEVGLALMGVELDGTRLNNGQHELVRALLSDPRRVALALAPAGSGKTTAMRALADTARALGLTPIGLAPSAAAAAVLGEATGMPTDTLAKLDHTLTTGGSCGIEPNTLVVIDEAGMADTLTLDRVIAAFSAVGARVRLIGDDQQLAAVGAGAYCVTSPASTALRG
jgi:ATP-dependent exoDNAse (exonuclease V) alpha subunit